MTNEKKKRRVFSTILVLIVILALLGGSVAIAISGNMRSNGKEKLITAAQAASYNADCIIVLGAGVEADGSPSLMLRHRLQKGIELYEAGASKRLLMTGDHGTEGYNEVGVMKNYAVEFGVPSSDVFMDHAGFSTYESLYRAGSIFGAKRVIIVTQEYHMYRALYIAEALGLEAVGVATDAYQYDRAGQAYREARELAARVKDYFVCIFKTKPTYLGETIPISGNGDVTND